MSVDLMLLQAFQPMAVQLSMKAALPLAKSLVTIVIHGFVPRIEMIQFDQSSEPKLTIWTECFITIVGAEGSPLCLHWQ